MHNRPSLQRSGSPTRGPQQERGLPGTLRKALGVPLFWKIVLANGLLMAMVGGTTAVVLSRPGHETLAPATLFLLLGGTLLAAAAVNAWIVGVALRPLDGIMETAEAVRLGDTSARAPESPLADARLARLGRLLNRMLDAMDEARGRQREISHQVLMAEERERERIAGELYAGTAQTLAGVLVRLQVVVRTLGDQVDPGPLQDVVSEVRAALEEVRAFARRLRPPELDELGVRVALEAHARGLSQHPGTPRIQFSGQAMDGHLSSDARLALFRVVQEALTNAARHSGGDLVTVTFRGLPEGLETVVVDDGRGFDPEAMKEDHPARLGLLTMIERAGYAEGRTEVDSTPGSGTRVRLVLPWISGDGTAGSAADALSGRPPEVTVPGL